MHDRSFRYTIRRALRVTDECMSRRDVDNAARPLRGNEMAAHLLAHEECAVDVRAHDAFPFVTRRIRGRTPDRYSRVIDQNIDAAMSFDDVLHRLLDACLRLQIEHHRRRHCTSGFERRNRLLEIGKPCRGDRDIIAVVRQRQRRRGTYAIRCSGDERDRSRQSSLLSHASRYEMRHTPLRSPYAARAAAPAPSPAILPNTAPETRPVPAG